MSTNHPELTSILVLNLSQLEKSSETQPAVLHGVEITEMKSRMKSCFPKIYSELSELRLLLGSTHYDFRLFLPTWRLEFATLPLWIDTLWAIAMPRR